MSQFEQIMYRRGEMVGRIDGAKRWGMMGPDAFSNQAEYRGYIDGYYSTCAY
jgi:hypothetical protein